MIVQILSIAWPLVIVRVIVIAVALALWFITQAMLAKRIASPVGAGGVVHDGIHQLTRRWHAMLIDNPKSANRLLILSSFVIDLLGAFLLIVSIFGPTMQPFIGLMIVFALRQICQAFCPLPPPVGMIWRNPGFPALLVTYETANDFFFSGHTAIAVYGATVLATLLHPWGILLGFVIAIFEAFTVLILRAHYTMDVFTGVIVALYVHTLVWKFAPTIDLWIGTLAGKF